MQADQATVASEEAAQGFQTLFDCINRLNQSELKESLNINLKTLLKLISFYEIYTCYFSEVIWRPPNGLFPGMMNFEGQVSRFSAKSAYISSKSRGPRLYHPCYNAKLRFTADNLVWLIFKL